MSDEEQQQDAVAMGVGTRCPAGKVPVIFVGQLPYRFSGTLSIPLPCITPRSARHRWSSGTSTQIRQLPFHSRFLPPTYVWYP